MCPDRHVYTMKVREVMSADIVTVGTDAPIREAIGSLLSEAVGSVVVVDEGVPVGVVTETDLLRACFRAHDELDGVTVGDLAHRPCVTVGPEATIQKAARKMADDGVKKVPVVEDLDLVGMITLTDVVWHLSDIRKEATDLAEAHYDWES